MVDKVSPEVRTRTMRAVKSKDSRMEVAFRSALWRLGLRFYKNSKKLPGKPDIVFPKKKIVIFLDSCFWHGCPQHLRKPVSNVDYWQAKFERNQKRDAQVNDYYREKHWRVIRLWEHELKANFDGKIAEVAQAVREN